jgi:hypothetical protein
VLRNAQRKGVLPTVQPVRLNQERQTANVIRMRVGDPYGIKIWKPETQIQELRTTRLPSIEKHVVAAKLKKNAGLKAARSHSSRARSKKGYRCHLTELVEDLLVTDKQQQAKKLHRSTHKLKSNRCGSCVNTPSGYFSFAS